MEPGGIKQKVSKTETDNTFSFEKLPPELRNIVYEYALPRNLSVSITRKHTKKQESKNGQKTKVKQEASQTWTLKAKSPGWESVGKGYGTGLVRSNKAIHAEVLPMLYSNCIFFFNTQTSLTQFLERTMLGLQYVRHVILTGWSRGRHFKTNMNLLGSLRSLQHLHIKGYGVAIPTVEEVISSGLYAAIESFMKSGTTEKERHTLFGKLNIGPVYFSTGDIEMEMVTQVKDALQ